MTSGGHQYNTGDTNHDGLLEAGETWVFTASGTAIAGQYSNIGTATGTPPTGPNVTATNPDHYFGETPAIQILKLTNGTNNDSPPVAGVPDGPIVAVGSTVTWTYNVTATGSNVPLSNVTVTDNIAGVNPTPVLVTFNGHQYNTGDTNHDGLLEAGETWVFTASGTATAGQYSNIGTATGTPPTGPNVTATNPDHYFGQTPAQPLGKGDTATIGFWHNKNGQGLITGATPVTGGLSLANWLASNFSYLYGANAPAGNNLTNASNATVAALFLTFFGVKGMNTDAQIMGGALAMWFTNSSLNGNTSASANFGFNISAGGTGGKTYIVGSDGTAIGLQNNTSYTIFACSCNRPTWTR